MVCAAASEVIAEHAPPRMGHAHGSVNKSLDLYILRQLTPQKGYLPERKLAGEHDPLRAHPGEHPGGGRVHDVGLRAYVQRQVRNLLAQE